MVREQAREGGQEDLLKTPSLDQRGLVQMALLAEDLRLCKPLLLPCPPLACARTWKNFWSLEPVLPAFQAAFTVEATDMARAAGMHCDVLVMDGNAKSRRAASLASPAVKARHCGIAAHANQSWAIIFAPFQTSRMESAGQEVHIFSLGKQTLVHNN